MRTASRRIGIAGSFGCQSIASPFERRHTTR